MVARLTALVRPNEAAMASCAMDWRRNSPAVETVVVRSQVGGGDGGKEAGGCERRVGGTDEGRPATERGLLARSCSAALRASRSSGTPSRATQRFSLCDHTTTSRLARFATQSRASLSSRILRRANHSRGSGFRAFRVTCGSGARFVGAVRCGRSGRADLVATCGSLLLFCAGG